MTMRTNGTVVMRNVTDADVDIFFVHQTDSTANHMAAFMLRDPNDQVAFLAHWEKIRADPTVTLRTIVLEKCVAGYVGSFKRVGKPEVCYWIGKEYWRKGIASAALSQFLLEFKDRPYYARVAEDNLASIRVLEKCGFETARRERSFAKARGKEIDEVVMKLD